MGSSPTESTPITVMLTQEEEECKLSKLQTVKPYQGTTLGGILGGK